MILLAVGPVEEDTVGYGLSLLEDIVGCGPGCLDDMVSCGSG